MQKSDMTDFISGLNLTDAEKKLLAHNIDKYSEDRYEKGHNDGYNDGYEDGRSDCDDGYDAGYEDGLEAGREEC